MISSGVRIWKACRFIDGTRGSSVTKDGSDLRAFEVDGVNVLHLDPLGLDELSNG